ncbi:hypothetical protein CHUAL_012500 [Chamberlinius hualienensis]
MRTIVALISLLGIVATCNAEGGTVFQPNYEYVYHYLGHAITSMDGSNQTAGYAQQATLLIKLRNGCAEFQIADMETALINDQLNTTDITKIPFEFQPLRSWELKRPYWVYYENGRITHIETKFNESVHAVSIKKALASVFQLQLDPVLNGDESSWWSEGSPPDTGSVIANDDLSTYDVYEDGIAGECLSKYVVESEPWSGKPLSKVLNITKINDYTDCKENISLTVSSHPPTNCTDCEADDLIPIDSTRVLKYNVKLDKIFAITRIESVGGTIYRPLADFADKFFTNHSQLFILEEVHPMPLARSYVVPKGSIDLHESLEIEFHSASVGDSTDDDKYENAAPFMPTNQKILPFVFTRCLDDVIKDLKSSRKEDLFQTPLKIYQCSRIIGHFSERFLDVIFKKYNGTDDISRNAVVASFKMSGSLPVLHYLLTLIQNNPDWSHAPWILSSLPFYVVEPNSEFIVHVAKICPRLRNTAAYKPCWLSYANLVNLACVDPKPELDDVPHCSELNETIFIKLLGEQLRLAYNTEYKLLFIKTLKMTGSAKILQFLKPYVVGEFKVKEMVRVMAIEALSEVENDTIAQQQILHMTSEIVYDKDESSVVRIAAIHSFMTSNPRPYHLQRLATITFDDDEDDEVISLISSFIDTTSNETTPCYSNEAARARTALPFVKDNDVFIQNSQYRVFDYVDDDLKLSSRLDFGWIANNRTILNSRMWWLGLEKNIAGFVHQPIAFKGYLEGVESVLKRLLGPKAAAEQLSLHDIFAPAYNSTPKDFFRLFQKLKIDPRRDEPLSLYLESKLGMFADSLYYLSAADILKKINDEIGISTNTKIDQQYISTFGFFKHKRPTPLGVPLFVEFKSPAILDLKGTLSIEAPSVKEILTGKKSLKVLIKSDVRPTFSMNLMTVTGIIDPFYDVYASVGVRTETFVSIPHQIKVDIDVPNGKVETTIKLTKSDTTGPEVTLFRYKVEPFAVLFPYDKTDINPRNYSVIWRNRQVYSNEFVGGEELVGVPFRFKVKSDSLRYDQGSWYNYLFSDNTPLSLATYWWATPDFSYRKYEVTMNTEKASKAEFKSLVDVDVKASNIQKMYWEGLNDFRGSLGYLTLWSQMPFKCKDTVRRLQSSTRTLMRPKRDSSHVIIEEIPFTSENAKIALKIHLEKSVTGNIQRSFKSDITLKRNIVDLKDEIEILTNIQTQRQNNILVNVKGAVVYPEIPCSTTSSWNPSLIEPIFGNLKIEFGDNQHSLKAIKFDAIVNKTKSQLQSELEGDSWEYEQCKKDMREGGKKLSSSCQLLSENIADLKKTNVSIRYDYQDLPAWLINATYKAEDFLKFLWYEHMEENYVDINNKEGKLDFEVKFDVDDPVIDIKISKPKGQIFFKNIYYPAEISSLLRPFNARYSYFGLISDYLTGGYAPATVSVMNNSLLNFDNVTYPLPLTKCKHVITKDCSSSDLFSVLMSQLPSGVGKELQVYLIDHSVTVRRISSSPATYDVIIDDEDRKLTESKPILFLKQTTKPANGMILASIYVIGDILHIKSPLLGFSVKFDGSNAKIKASNFHRGELCGISSEFDGFSDHNFIGPRKCEYVDVKDFVNSYYVPSVVCPPLPSSSKKICPVQPSIGSLRRKVYRVDGRSAPLFEGISRGFDKTFEFGRDTVDTGLEMVSDSIDTIKNRLSPTTTRRPIKRRDRYGYPVYEEY